MPRRVNCTFALPDFISSTSFGDTLSTYTLPASLRTFGKNSKVMPTNFSEASFGSSSQARHRLAHMWRRRS